MGKLIQFVSDLHLEMPRNKAYIEQFPLKPLADTLVLAGDIVPFYLLDKFKDFFKYLSDTFKTVYWLPGNHEYYHWDINNRAGSFCESILPNVHLLNNTAITFDNKCLLFSTLWAKIGPANALAIQNTLSDFSQISKGKRLFSVDDFNELHEESMLFLGQHLATAMEKSTAVFTHHCPTFYNYPNEFKGSNLNEGFTVELYEFINYSKFKYWVYGHTHSNTPSFIIGETEVLCNQLGYVRREAEAVVFKQRCIEL